MFSSDWFADCKQFLNNFHPLFMLSQFSNNLMIFSQHEALNISKVRHRDHKFSFSTKHKCPRWARTGVKPVVEICNKQLIWIIFSKTLKYLLNVKSKIRKWKLKLNLTCFYLVPLVAPTQLYLVTLCVGSRCWSSWWEWKLTLSKLSWLLNTSLHTQCGSFLKNQINNISCHKLRICVQSNSIL